MIIIVPCSFRCIKKKKKQKKKQRSKEIAETAICRGGRIVPRSWSFILFPSSAVLHLRLQLMIWPIIVFFS